MTETRIGYARCSTNKQDLAAQQAILAELGVAPDRIYMDRGLGFFAQPLEKVYSRNCAIPSD